MSTGALILFLLLIALLTAASYLFSAIETSFFSLQPYHVERLKAARSKFAAALSRLMENPRRLVSALLLGDALVNLPLILLCLYVMRNTAAGRFPFWAVALVIFGIVVIACDLVPKIAALANPYRFVRVGVRLLTVAMPIVDPLASLLQRAAEWVARRVIPPQLNVNQSLSEEELETLLQLGAEEGALHATEKELIHEILKLGDKTVRDCMTPRVDAFTLPDDLTNEQLMAKLRARRSRRVVIYGETPDEIVGILDVRLFFTLQPKEHYTEYLNPPSFVPETMEAYDLLRAFLHHPQALAIVIDEHGGTEGVITMADIVEEILSDAVPKAEQALYIQPVGEGRFLVSGNARIDDINEALGSHLGEEGIDTIGGLVFNHLGELPKAGARAELPGVAATVRRSSGKRIEELLVERSDGARPV